MNLRVIFIASGLLLLGCSSNGDGSSSSDAEHQREVIEGMHQSLLSDLEVLHGAAGDLRDVAPVPQGRGWDAAEDEEAIASMTEAWVQARSAYERVEGAIAPLFPDLDRAIDARYEDFLQELGDDGDQDLFDDQGVTGMHAIERILYVPTTPESVVEVESTLLGYQAAAWPATEAEAAEFKEKLAARLVADTQELRDQWQPQHIDLAGAFEGLVSLMNEQREKVNKAASEEEESRYAQRTMADLRDNLAGTTNIYALFQSWLLTKPDGAEIDSDIEAAFDALDTAYSDVNGDSIPRPPETWSSESPSKADLGTPFGRLYQAVQDAVDPNRAGSAVDGMNRAAVVLGLMEPADG